MESVTIVLHSCETGQIRKDGMSLAQELSKGLNNVTIIAPTEKVYTPEGKEIGTYNEAVEENKSADGKVILSPEYLGKWIQYENGEQTRTYRGNTHPGEQGYNIVTSQSSIWDKIIHAIENFF